MSLLSLWIARRYLFSRKSHSVINLISWVSAFTVAIPVAAMIVLLSVFNGFDGLIKQMYKNFDPDIKIELKQGKFFKDYPNLSDIDGVKFYSEILDQTALFEYREHQYVGTMRGVDSMYRYVVPIENTLTRGRWQPEFGTVNQAIVGQGIAYTLGVNVSVFYPLNVYVPKNGPVSPFVPVESVRSQKLFPVGVFSLDAQSDGEFVIVPIRFARTLVGEGKTSSIAVKLSDDADPLQVKRNLESVLGEQFVIKTRAEQKQSLYKIMQYEKWGIYTILLLVMIIGAFGMVGALVMLIMDKQRDIKTFTAMGLTIAELKKIFVNEGLMLAAIGGLIGGLVGGALCLGQAHYGWVKLQGQSFLIDYYPVDVHLSDVLLVYFSVVVVAWLMSLVTVSLTFKSYEK